MTLVMVADENNGQYCFAGQFLVAMPHMKDPRFHEAVVLLCGHDAQGAMGLIINKPLDSLELSEVLTQIGMELSENLPCNYPIFFGGPVEIGRGFILHSAEYDHETSVQLTEGVALSSTSKVIEDTIQGKGPEQFLLALGYAGWSAGQLEAEIKENGWITLPASLDLIFYKDKALLWHEVLMANGIRPDALTTQIGHS